MLTNLTDFRAAGTSANPKRRTVGMRLAHALARKEWGPNEPTTVTAPSHDANDVTATQTDSLPTASASHGDEG